MGKDVKDSAGEVSKNLYVKLVSSDDHEFYIKRDLAFTSQTIKAMLSGPGSIPRIYCSYRILFFLVGQYAENETNVIHFRSISSQVSVTNTYSWIDPIACQVLERICSYFAYKARYSNSTIEIPEFPIAPENALEILMAANFLDC